ncbi:hypothetical protein BGZ72_004936 [Mortierella alpina]|nr:hypothetical protein BGZ72_004936 [Mortierella alpina]
MTNCDIIRDIQPGTMDEMLERSQLYILKPCPFGNKDLSESLWCREAWPIMKVLLADVDGLTMIGGEKAGLESGKRRDMGRKVDTETPAPRKQAGRKVDLVARDTTNIATVGDSHGNMPHGV